LRNGRDRTIGLHDHRAGRGPPLPRGRLKRSRGVKAGPDENNLYEIKSRTEDDAYGPPALLDGIYEIGMAPTTPNEAVVLIRSDDPLPMTLTAVYLDPVVTE
jgi:hypothetical protein